MIGVAIIAFNRPHYLRRLLASLEQQTDLYNVDFHLYLDGAVNKWSGECRANISDIRECAHLFLKSRLPEPKWLHPQAHNVSVGINTFTAIEEMTATYERIMLLEDDVVLSPHWFRLARILYAELNAHPDVFSFSPGFKRIGDDLGALVSRRNYMWHECFTADRWLRMRDTYLDYYTRFIEGRDYYYRDLDGIRGWHKAQGIDENVTSQDAGRLTSIAVNGMHRVQCAVNRALGIGKHGIHFSPEFYADEGFAKQTPFIFDEDATRAAFVWND